MNYRLMYMVKPQPSKELYVFLKLWCLNSPDDSNDAHLSTFVQNKACVFVEERTWLCVLVVQEFQFHRTEVQIGVGSFYNRGW